jgi:hypothetical protein
MRAAKKKTSPIDTFLGQSLEGHSFTFIDVDTLERSKIHTWPIVPAVGDVIDTRAGATLVVRERRISYDRALSIDVYVKKKERPV